MNQPRSTHCCILTDGANWTIQFYLDATQNDQTCLFFFLFLFQAKLQLLIKFAQKDDVPTSNGCWIFEHFLLQPNRHHVNIRRLTSLQSKNTHAYKHTQDQQKHFFYALNLLITVWTSMIHEYIIVSIVIHDQLMLLIWVIHIDYIDLNQVY